MNCIICAIAKMENAYIYDWASYHVQLGFRYIHIYDNNEVDGERIEDVFRGTPIEQQIIIHDVRGKKYMQKPVYQECYDTESFDWCAFIDIDEYITLPDGQDINAFLANKEGWDAVHLNWMCFGDNGLVRKDDRPVTERFKRPWKKDVYYGSFRYHENETIKSIVRSGLTIDWVNGDDTNPHTPKGLNKVCNAVGIAVSNEPFVPICYDGGYIRHYQTKTIEEFAIKVNRQCADCDAVGYAFPGFFRVNIPTIRKLCWLKHYNPHVSLWACYREYIKFALVNYRIWGHKHLKSYRRINEEK